MLLKAAVVLVEVTAFPLPCADNNSKSFNSIALKLHSSVNRHRRKIKFHWHHYCIFYARVMPLLGKCCRKVTHPTRGVLDC